MREYEVMVVFDPDAEDPAVNGVIERVTTFVKEHGGEVRKEDRWGKRKLAYEIGHKADGTYVLIEFTSEPGPLPEMERLLTLADEVIRHKVIKRAA
ncbi:MAG TPA: 30S ribosomal protein S6 [Actinomycetota bacterium]|jgi:small subunit ribosomal protein S6